MTSSPNPPASSSAWNRNAALILGITLINLLGIPMITPALPAMREAVGVTDEQLGLVMTAYALPALIIVPFVGLLADRYGKKLVLIPSLFLFSIAGSAVGWAENLETLLTLRLVQGLGASGLSNLSVALIGDYFSGHDRARVMGRMGAAQIIAAGGYVDVRTGSAVDANSIPIPKPDADSAFDAAACIGCGACVASCKNASAMLFVAAKVSHLGHLPQGQPERDKRVLAMVRQMDAEGFGNCTNQYECEAACPKEISVDHIARLNRDYTMAVLREQFA